VHKKINIISLANVASQMHYIVFVIYSRLNFLFSVITFGLLNYIQR